MEFKGKNILVTGGSRGIGAAVARAFAERGGRVAVTYLQAAKAAEDLINELPGEDHFAIQCPMENPEAIRRLINTVAKRFGRLDVVINNAGIYEGHPIDKVSYAEWQQSWEKSLQVNLQGPANVCYCAAQYMIMQKGGRIINISSRGAFRGEPNHPAYGAAKAGLNAMSQSLAQALGKYNIFVGVVAPGFVATDMARSILEGPEGEAIKAQSPLQRVARPEEIANAVLFMATEGTDYMTGAILDINGASYLRS